MMMHELANFKKKYIFILLTRALASFSP